MVEIKLYKKEGTYFSKEKNKDVPFTNYYLKVGDELIPVEVKYFSNPSFDGRDPGYSARRAVLSAFAEILPEREKKNEAKA